MIKLPVYWIDEKDEPLHNVGIDVDPVLRDVYFYSIDHFYKHGGRLCVVSGGLEYQSPISMNEFIEILCQEK